MLIKHLSRSWRLLRVRFTLPCVRGNADVGWCAKYPWERNWCWASQRSTVEFGARQRALELLDGSPG